MPDPSNNSFIPKRGPATHSKRGSGSRRIYLFSIISYVLLFATLLASGGIFLYNKYLNKQLDEEVTALNTEMAGFSETSMQKVLEFDARLRQASNRLDNSVSMLAIFQAVEAATIDTVAVKDLSLERIGDEKYILTVNINTDSFDSTIFQRGVYQRNQTIEGVTISALAANAEQNEEGEIVSGDPDVSFIAELEIPVAAIPYEPADVIQRMTREVVPMTEATASSESRGTASTSEVINVAEDNEETI